MTSERRAIEEPAADAVDPGRREFMARSKTRDGTCDAAFVHPATGSHPGVLIWPDAFGLRPTVRSMARRLAGEGYAVLVPNLFYRVSKSPQFESAANVQFADQSLMTKLRPLMDSVNASGAAEGDAQAYIAFFDAHPLVDRAKKIGTQGYCAIARRRPSGRGASSSRSTSRRWRSGP